MPSPRAKTRGAPPKEPKSPFEGKYYQAVGRRKEAVAQVRLFTDGKKAVVVNQKPLADYFVLPELRTLVEAPLEQMKVPDTFGASIMVAGGGKRGQAEAARLGIARALTLYNADFRKRLKRLDYLRRDPREKERRKYGLKKARKRPQWQKR